MNSAPTTESEMGVETPPLNNVLQTAICMTTTAMTIMMAMTTMGLNRYPRDEEPRMMRMPDLHKLNVAEIMKTN